MSTEAIDRLGKRYEIKRIITSDDWRDRLRPLRLVVGGKLLTIS